MVGSTHGDDDSNIEEDEDAAAFHHQMDTDGDGMLSASELETSLPIDR